MRILFAFIALLLGAGLAVAEDYEALISKVEDGNVRFTTLPATGKPISMTLKVAENVKVVKAKFNKEQKRIDVLEEIKGGLKNEIFDIEKNNRLVRSQLITDGVRITEIRVLSEGKKTKDTK